MSEGTYTEVTGNIVVHHPIRREPWVRSMNQAFADLRADAEASTMTEAELRKVFGLPTLDQMPKSDPRALAA